MNMKSNFKIETLLIKLACCLAYVTWLVILNNYRRSLRTEGVFDLSDLSSESGIDSGSETESD